MQQNDSLTEWRPTVSGTTAAGVATYAAFASAAIGLPDLVWPRLYHGLPLPFNCLSTAFHCLSSTFYCLTNAFTMPFHCLFSTFHCLSTVFP